MQGRNSADTAHSKYSSTIGTIAVLLREEGIGGFYKGLRPKILQTALNAALMMALKEQCFNLLSSILKQNFARKNQKSNLVLR